jgi:cobaltochelatase CobN
MRHGYKGAFEIAATVDYLFGYAATTDAVAGHHFDLLYEAYLGDETVRAFMADANPDALRETAERFSEAIDRGLWRPASNSARDMLQSLTRSAEKAL